MARVKMYFKWEIPTSVVNMVNSICADYERRERAIKYSSITGPVLAKYIQLNSVIDDALNDVEVGIRGAILRDIAEGRGYNRSHTQGLASKNTYYRRRRKLIHDIAKSLSLL